MTEISETLKNYAARYADLTTEVKRAQQEFSQAQCRVAGIVSELSSLRRELGKHVGQNIPDRLITTSGGTVLISRDSDAPDLTTVKVFGPDGTEIR